MFYTIFKYEYKHWLRQPSLYIYALFFLVISLGTMWGMAAESSSESVRIINSPRQINVMANLFNTLLLFLLPSIIGLSIYRDFQHNMHTLLYSFPFTKRDYLLGKLLSSVSIVILIVAMIGLGFMVGPYMPGVNPANVVPFNIQAYLQLYLVFLLPNILLFGAIIFSVVTFTRNIYAGFIAVILIIILQAIIEGILKGVEWRYFAALFDPLGDEAVKYYTRHWTLAERNELLIPLKGVIIHNRLLWSGIALVIFGSVFRYFKFSQQGFTTKAKKGSAERVVKENFGQLIKVELPKVHFDFSFLHQLRTAWQLSQVDFRHIIRSWLFISILLGGFLAIFFQQAEMNPLYGFKLLPVTWKMLFIPSFIYSGLINLVTFLFAGMLIHRAQLARMNHLVDISPLPNWAFLLSKVLALVKIQVLLLGFIILAGLVVQLSNGFYDVKLGLYISEVYGLHLIHFVIWACLAIFVQTLSPNPYLGFFFLLLIPLGTIMIPSLADMIGWDFLKQAVFLYNQVPGHTLGFDYSDLNQYASFLPTYWVYKSYWLLGGLCLVTLSYLFWTRGIPSNFSERLSIAKARFHGPVLGVFVLLSCCFIGAGAGIYLEENLWHKTRITDEDEKTFKVENEKRYQRYESLLQPRVTAVKIDMDLYPNQKAFRASGSYTLVNKAAKAIDTLLIAYSFREKNQYTFDRETAVISQDSQIKFDVLRLLQSLQPGDSLQMNFQVENEDNTLFNVNSRVLANGTFIGSQIFPQLGYRKVELTDNAARKKEGLAEKTTSIPLPSDTTALGYAYSENDSDWIDFEATVSTTTDQMAFAPGVLQKEWTEEGRRFFHYKTAHKIADVFCFNSGRYAVKKDQWEDTEIAIYYHPGHDYNLNSLMEGVKASLSYNSRWFGPYKHTELRIVEYPKTEGTYATIMGNLMPYSELYLIGDIDTTGAGSIDLPFYVSAHEVAHHWWGHQVNPANILGGKMVSESMAEYVGLKVLEGRYRKAMIRRFLRQDLDLYLTGRANERKKETPLLYAYPHQEYINYQKGALVFYALSDYVGEEVLNKALRAYLEKMRYKGPPLPHSLGLLAAVQTVIPDSLQYLVKDLFETVTLYDNQIESSTITPLTDGRYQLDINFTVSKFRSDGFGHRLYSDNQQDSLQYMPTDAKATISSLPLADYIEVGVFGAEKTAGESLPIYLQKHKITAIHNRISVIVDQKPLEVGVDPYHKLIDVLPEDNRKQVK